MWRNNMDFKDIINAYNIGCELAYNQEKIARQVRFTFKNKPKKKKTKDTKKSISATKTVNRLNRAAKPFEKKITKAVELALKKAPKKMQPLAKKLVDKGATKALKLFEPAYIANKARSSEGRKQLAKEYSLIAPKNQKPKDSLTDAGNDLLDTFTASPFSIGGTSSRARTLDRVRQGAEAQTAAKMRAASKGNKEQVENLVNADPRIMF